MVGWLEKELEGRSVGEVSVYYAITVMGAFLIFMCVLGGASVMGLEDKLFGIAAIAALVVWLGFLVWLYWAIVKVGRTKLQGQAGAEIFKIINVAFVGMTVVTFIVHRGWREGAEPFWIVLIAFDIFVLFSGLFFFPMAWMIGCKVPKRTYLDFAIMALMVVLQIWAMS